jgi:hypothetical protein
MPTARIFIASSSEGLEVTRTIHGLLLQALPGAAEVLPWTREFDLSATYIESLEKACKGADFAVLVLSADDVTTSRRRAQASPRDNVVFELGLFMGHLGRMHCFVVQEKRPGELKVPSDLLGVHVASFSRPADGNWRAALDPAVAQIVSAVTAQGARFKLSAESLAALESTRSFHDRLAGAWWERIAPPGGARLSFVEMQPEEAWGLRISGSAYAATGDLDANWRTLLTRAERDAQRVLYYWEGWHLLTPADCFHGFGEMEFESVPGGQPMGRGKGRFWDIDDADPGRSVVKPIELRRIADAGHVERMKAGRQKDVRALVTRTLEDW